MTRTDRSKAQVDRSGVASFPTDACMAHLPTKTIRHFLCEWKQMLVVTNCMHHHPFKVTRARYSRPATLRERYSSRGSHRALGRKTQQAVYDPTQHIMDLYIQRIKRQHPAGRHAQMHVVSVCQRLSQHLSWMLKKERFHLLHVYCKLDPRSNCINTTMREKTTRGQGCSLLAYYFIAEVGF